MRFLWLFLISIFLTVTSGDKPCDDENAHYITCGTLCEPKCPEMNSKETLDNCSMCIIGCHCKPGYVLHDSKCILPENCPSKE
ncbi:venom peptide SjAPI-like [Onthophagus taurus]|uniref:venom peptide SjAPI-like n=1 Tax=Onthophagus taurus TaxID=166361 RepID=UPI000C209D07|nr:cysteine-rich venom protein 1-like [Onthophagus taurus]